MKTVYDADGKSYEVDSVDAREYVAGGNYFYEKPENANNPVQEEIIPVDAAHKKKFKR